MTDKKKNDELAELKARVAELERAAAPPKPYVDDWVVPPHPIDRLSMPMSAMREMAQAVPDSVLRGIVADNRAPQGPSSQGPASQTVSNVPRGVPGGGTGWQREIPISPPPGVHHIDRMMAHDDIEFRRQRIAEAQALKAVTEEDKPNDRQTKEGDV